MSRTSEEKDPSPRQVRVRCPAKINLYLRVGPARSDGFHPLLTWMCTIGLFDTLEMRRAKPAESPAAPPREPTDRVRLTCIPESLPSDHRNLVVRIVNGYAENRCHLRGSPSGIAPIEAKLVKSIPMGAGLGGGSSDAAAALMGAQRLWDDASEPVPAEDLSAFAGRFGSDIPFFFHTPSAICIGRGEIVRPIGPPAAKAALLVLPPIEMPTPAVYRKFDEMRLGETQDIEIEPDWSRWQGLSGAELMQELVNDLEPPAMALRPDLESLRRRVEQAIGRTVRMSGSGSSLFTLFDESAEAVEAKERLEKQSSEPTVRLEAVEIGPELTVESIAQASSL